MPALALAEVVDVGSRRSYVARLPMPASSRDSGVGEAMSVKRDHEAMEALRSASLKKGWKWQWDGMDLRQVTLGPGAPNTHKDPADAVLSERKEGP